MDKSKDPTCLKCGKEVTDAADVVKHREGLCGACWALALTGSEDDPAGNDADDTLFDQQLLAAVRTACHDLAYKGVDCQVFASAVAPKNGETVTAQSGIGNIHARRGMVSAWLEQQMQEERDYVSRKGAK